MKMELNLVVAPAALYNLKLPLKSKCLMCVSVRILERTNYIVLFLCTVL